MDRKESIQAALEALEKMEDDSPHLAAIIVMAPGAEFISGNSTGFVKLAIASLKAAQGQAQRFKGLPWVGTGDYDWMLSGLTPDENAHTYLPPKKTRRSWIVDKILLVAAALIGIFLSACLSVGAIHIFHSIFSR
jgi:hypothetical protein